MHVLACRSVFLSLLLSACSLSTHCHHPRIHCLRPSLLYPSRFPPFLHFHPIFPRFRSRSPPLPLSLSFARFVSSSLSSCSVLLFSPRFSLSMTLRHVCQTGHHNSRSFPPKYLMRHAIFTIGSRSANPGAESLTAMLRLFPSH